MIELDSLLLFLLTTLVVVLSPGPAVLAVVTESIAQGRERALSIILGIAAANVVYFVLSATGIAALVIASGWLFSVIKWLGVVYLCYLGVRTFVGKIGPLELNLDLRSTLKPTPKKPPTPLKVDAKVWLRGFSLELANPKALLYFSALLPQFIDIAQPIFPQLALFCLITFVLDLLCYGAYAYLGSKAIALNGRPLIGKIFKRVAGGLLIFAGLKMAVTV